MDYIQEIVNSANDRFQKKRDQQDEYWQNWLVTQKAKLDAMEVIDPVQKSLYDLMELAISLKQYERPEDENSEVSRLIRFSIRGMSREEIEKVFEVETYSLRGAGIYTIMDGLLLTRETRERTGFDTTGIHRWYDLSMFTKEQQETYNFSLSSAARGGLFIPKRTRLLGWIQRRFQLQYFDITSI